MAGLKFITKHEFANSTTARASFTSMNVSGYSWLRIFISGRGTASADASMRMRMGINSDPWSNTSGGREWYMGKDAGNYYANNYNQNEFNSDMGLGFPQDGSAWSYNSSTNKSMGCWQIDLPLPDQAAEGGQVTYYQLGYSGGFSTNVNGATGLGRQSGRVVQGGFRWSTSYSSDMVAVTELTFDIDNNNWRQGSAIYIYGFET
jgi:hypothetical protein